MAECFAEIGARTTLLPGSDVYPALERGTIDAADFVGPAVNYDLGFHQVTNYIVMGPTSTPCLHQPVDLMDISLSMRAWEGLFDELKELLPELVAAYSAEHYAGIQAANRKVWPKYREAGTEVTRLSEEDVVRFREVAIPKWFEWANKDAGAARLFQIHLDVMQDPEVGWSIQARSRAIRSTSEAAAIPSHMAGRGPAVPVLPSRRIVPARPSPGPGRRRSCHWNSTSFCRT